MNAAALLLACATSVAARGRRDACLEACGIATTRSRSLFAPRSRLPAVDAALPAARAFAPWRRQAGT
jgi:hypothetical protein